MTNKVALIFGITGQDGSYLAELLLKKGYVVNGVKRRSSSINTLRIDHIYRDPHEKNYKFRLHYGDITDSSSVSSIIKQTKPDEIYNLAAQSVAVSFEVPSTLQMQMLGALRILEAIKFHKLEKRQNFIRLEHLKCMEKSKIPQDENTQFYPLSPYGVAKLYAHWITKNYREAYNIFASNGILFNHESPRRGETFVTKKIVSALCKIKEKKQKKLFLGNINAKRDWGHARDYCLAMWKILQQKKPDDYVIATGVQYSIKEFVNLTAKNLGMQIFWRGKGIQEKAYNKKGEVIIECDKNYFRPLDVNTLLGNAKKARKKLKWKPQENIHSLIEEMIKAEYKNLV